MTSLDTAGPPADGSPRGGRRAWWGSFVDRIAGGGGEPGRGTGGGQRASDEGSCTSERIGQRRVYALRPGSPRDLAAALSRITDTAGQDSGPHTTHDRHVRSLRAERLAAQEPGWADDRTFAFHRSLTGRPELVWRHLTEAALLAHWWTVDRLALTVFPVFLGGGPRLFDDGLPAGRWTLAGQAAGEHGTLALVYDRVRRAGRAPSSTA
ncbi:hypothetical protein ACWEGQ_28945 [Streptomyces seoulensis]